MQAGDTLTFMWPFVLGLVLGAGSLAGVLRGRDLRLMATFGLPGRLVGTGSVVAALGALVLALSLLGVRLGLLGLGLLGLGVALTLAGAAVRWQLRGPVQRELPGEGAVFGRATLSRIPGGVTVEVQGRAVTVRGEVSARLGSAGVAAAARRLPPLLLLQDGTVWVRASWGEGRAGGRRYAPLNPYLLPWLAAPR